LSIYRKRFKAMKKRYKKGEKISSIFQFMTEHTFNNPVYWAPNGAKFKFGKVRKNKKFLSMKFVENWPLRLIKNNIDAGNFYKAVKIEKEKK
jgi:hypothetical protein